MYHSFSSSTSKRRPVEFRKDALFCDADSQEIGDSFRHIAPRYDSFTVDGELGPIGLDPDLRILCRGMKRQCPRPAAPLSP
jgi:hypothetical protein